ncbi:MAG TPA: hypothetical protein VHU83_11145 [Bryobacteraceae bacterium]|nr:hypothetical protein [Bryobacteraceae bacterium]
MDSAIRICARAIFSATVQFWETHTGGGVLRSGWFQSYFGRAGKRLAAGTSAGAQRQDLYQSKGCHDLVLTALADARFHFRTVPAIAAETGIPEASVRSILEAHPDEVRKLPLRDGNGHFLYTLRSRPRTAREILAETRASLAGSTK